MSSVKVDAVGKDGNQNFGYIWENLPRDAIVLIAERLGMDEMKALRMVSKHWFASVNCELHEVCVSKWTIQQMGSFANVMRSIASHFHHLRSLRVRGLRDSDVADIGLFLPNLRSLDLGMVKIGDRGAAHLRALTKLEALHLSGTEVGDVGLAMIARSLESLTELDLWSTKVTDAGMRSIACLQNLTSLELGGTLVSDDGLRYIARLPELKSLHLSWTAVTDAGVRHLSSLNKLTSLDLIGTELADAGMSHLTKLSGLVSLNICCTKVGTSGMAHVVGLTNLTPLKVKWTQSRPKRVGGGYFPAPRHLGELYT